VSLLALSAVLAVGTAQVSQPNDLRSFLKAADEYNLDHRIALETRERAVWEFHQAWTGLLPAVTVAGNYTHNQYEFVIPPPLFGPQPVYVVYYDNFGGAVRIDLPLIDATRWMRVASAGDNKEGAAERELAMRDLVRRQVVAGYFGYAAALAVLESSQKSLAVAEAQLKLTDIRTKAGSATELELLRASAEVERNRQTVTDSVSLVATSRRMLRTLSGVDPAEMVPLPATDTRPEPTYQELEQQVDGLPSVRAADRDQDAARHSAYAARLSLVPTVSAQFAEQLTTAPGLNGGHNTAYTDGVAFTWRLDGPTLTGMGVQAHASAAARLAAEKARVTARDQIHSDWQRFNAGLQKVEAAESQVQAATRALQVARDKYAVGAATQVEVIQAERDLFSAEVGQIQARTELASARASLRISAGRQVLDD
jgi:outer membrane protein TolC